VRGSGPASHAGVEGDAYFQRTPLNAGPDSSERPAGSTGEPGFCIVVDRCGLSQPIRTTDMSDASARPTLQRAQPLTDRTPVLSWRRHPPAVDTVDKESFPMPIFEYRCSACGHLEEVLQKHNDPAPGTCPKCSAANTMAKELSLSAFHLKGGGWYKDLYSSSSGSSETSSTPPAATATPASTSTPATPAAPTAAAPAAAAPAPAAAPASPSSSGTGNAA
jgi:putative FmdB family regulatory protein